MRTVFNPFTGTFDYIGTPTTLSLQNAYDGGNTIATVAGVPVTISAPSASDNAFVVNVGQVGIGTLTPTYKLEVVENTGVTLGEHQVATIHDGSAAGLIFGYVADGAAKTSGFMRSFTGFDLTLGAGNTFDDAIFIDKDNGNVGIGGITTPLSALHILTGSDPVVLADRYFTGVNSPGFVGRHARGTVALPTALLSGDYLSTSGGRGYDGTAFSATSNSLIGFKTTENFTATNHGAGISFETTNNGTTVRTVKAFMDNNGDTLWSNGTFDFGGIVNGFSATLFPAPFSGHLTLDSLGAPNTAMGSVELAPGVFVDVVAVAMQPGSVGAINTVVDAALEDVATMNTFDGILLGSANVDTSTGRRIAIDDGTGAWRFSANGDTGNVGTRGTGGFGLVNGDSAIDTTSQVEIISTTKGFLEPRMTQAQRDAIVTPATGLQVYNTSTNELNFYNGTAWASVVDSFTNVLFDATVSDTAGADYPTVSAAVAAGARKLYLYDIITEVANTVLTLGNYVIYIQKGANWNFGDFRVTAGGLSNVDILGYGSITWAHTTSNSLWEPTTGTILNVNGITLTNNSTVASTAFAATTTAQKYNNVTVNIPDVAASFMGITVSGFGTNYLSNVNFVGAGTLSRTGLSLSTGSATNITISGTWSTTSPAIEVGTEGLISNFLANTNSAARIDIGGGQIAGYESIGAVAANIRATANGGVLSDANLNGGDLDLQGFTGFKVTNSTSDGLLDLSDPACQENFFTNCKFDTDITIGGDNNMFTNFRSDGALTIDADTNTFNGGQWVGDITISPTGESNTLTGVICTAVTTSLISGSRNRINSCVFSGGLNIVSGGVGNIINCTEAASGIIAGLKTRIIASRYTLNSAAALLISENEVTVIGTQVGQDAGGGVGTIKINVANTGCIILGCQTDADIDDQNGTNQLATNQTY